MIGLIKRVWESVRGTGDTALTVPPLDGAFLPNSVIDDASVFLDTAQPDNLVATTDELYFSSENTVYMIRRGSREPQVISKGNALVTALSVAPTEGVIVARSGEAPVILSPEGKEQSIVATSDWPHGDITAMAICPDGRIAYAVGSRKIKAADWAKDFLQLGRTGSIWQASVGGHPECLANGLAYPNGLIVATDGSLVVSLAWSSSLVKLVPNGSKTQILNNLPAYPAGLALAADGGFWLSCFAPRNQMLEFVLGENKFRTIMITEIEPQYWLVPRLKAQMGPLDPMLEGCTKKSAEIKPWAPSLSWGMVVKLDNNFQPLHSLHSRANGIRHGVRSSVEWDGRLLVASFGADMILDCCLDDGIPQ